MKNRAGKTKGKPQQNLPRQAEPTPGQKSYLESLAKLIAEDIVSQMKSRPGFTQEAVRRNPENTRGC